MTIRNNAFSLNFYVAVTAIFCALYLPQGTRAHALPYAVSFLSVDESKGQYSIATSFHIASYLFGDAEQEPTQAQIEAIFQLTEMEYQALTRKAEGRFKSTLKVIIDNRATTPAQVSFPLLSSLKSDLVPNGDIVQAPQVVATGLIPSSSSTIAVSYPEEIGSVLVTTRFPGKPHSTQMLVPGSDSYHYELTSNTSDSIQIPSWLKVTYEYLSLGFTHVIPKGLDHILFILGLFFLSPQLKPLIIQATAFTVAHSITLALAVLEVVSVPAWLVEPLIAASIIMIGIERWLNPQVKKFRIYIVFAFGLIHGLGFASVLNGLGIPEDALWVALLAFNVGVEIAQISILTVMFVLFYFAVNRNWYRQLVAIPSSIFIALAGTFWLYERVLL